MKFIIKNTKKIPWIFSRKLQLIAYTIDIVTYFLILKIHSYFNLINYLKLNPLIIFSLIIWLLYSYLFGRYYNPNLNNTKIFLILKSISLTIIFTFISVFILNESLFFITNSIELNESFFYFLNIYFSLSIIIQIFFKVYFSHNNKAKKWFYIGNSEAFNLISNEIRSYSKFEKIKLINVQEYKDIDNYDLSKFSGLCFDNLLNLNNKQLIIFNNLKNFKLNILDIIDWSILNFHYIPPKIIKFSNRKLIFLNPKKTSFDIRLKRVGDITLSLLILIITFPIVIVAIILIKLEDQGPIYYKQKRNGFNRKEFTILKLRSMKINAEDNGPRWTNSEDSRVTKVGKFLRRSRVDELPQLFSVIQGKMSLIGPRPEREAFDKNFRKEIPFYDNRYVIKPGLSGWAQVNYPYGASEKDAENKLGYDLYYIFNFSFLLDLLILFKTFKLVFNREGSLPIKK